MINQNEILKTQSWPKVAFGDVVRNVKVDVDPETSGLERYVAGEHMETDNLHITSWGDIGDGYLGPAFHRKFVKGQVLYGSRRTYLRKVAVAEFDGICANTTLVLEPKDGSLLPDLLPFIMQSESFTEFSVKNSKGSVNPYINWSDIARYEFPLPPLDEQRRIAEILWAADEVTVNWSEYLLRSESAKWRLFDQLFWKKNKTDNPALPNNWKLLPLSKCVHERGETSKHPHKKERYLGLENIEPGSWITSTFSDSSNFSSNCSVFYPGDLLYGKLRPNLDKAAIASFDGVCTTEILVLCNESFITNDFLLCHFHSPRFVEYNSHQAFGTKMPRTSFDIFGNYQIPVPPLEEQEEILETFHSLISTESEVKNHINMSRKLCSNLINQLLSV